MNPKERNYITDIEFLELIKEIIENNKPIEKTDLFILSKKKHLSNQIIYKKLFKYEYFDNFKQMILNSNPTQKELFTLKNLNNNVSLFSKSDLVIILSSNFGHYDLNDIKIFKEEFKRFKKENTYIKFFENLTNLFSHIYLNNLNEINVDNSLFSENQKLLKIEENCFNLFND